MAGLLKSSFYLPLQITIDDREPTSLEEAFRRKGNMIVERKRLPVGDYLFDQELLIERKTVSDFCQSIKDGRLFQQAGLLAKGQVPACLILEGKNRDFKRTDFSPEAIQGTLLSISLAFGLPVLKAKTSKKTSELMLQCYKQLSKQRIIKKRYYPATKGIRRKGNQLFYQKINILANFPGIGADRANRLLMKFPTLQAVFSANQDEFLQVPGIGKKTAESLFLLLNR